MDFAFALLSQKEEQVIASVVKEATIQESVRKAISLAGGLGFIKPGDAVLIKPNVNSYDPYPGTTPAIQSQNMWNHPQIKRAGKLEIGVSTYTGIRLRSSGVESDKFLPYLQGK